MNQIQRMASPGGMADMLVFLSYPIEPVRPGAEQSWATPTFWEQVLLGAATPWPVVADTTIQLGGDPSGSMFVVQDKHGVLCIGGFGLALQSEMWGKLRDYVLDTREYVRSVSQDLPNLPKLVERWENTLSQPTSTPWLVVVPLIGLRYYDDHASHILEQAAAFANEVLTLIATVENAYFSSPSPN